MIGVQGMTPYVHCPLTGLNNLTVHLKLILFMQIRNSIAPRLLMIWSPWSDYRNDYYNSNNHNKDAATNLTCSSFIAEGLSLIVTVASIVKDHTSSPWFLWVDYIELIYVRLSSQVRNMKHVIVLTFKLRFFRENQNTSSLYWLYHLPMHYTSSYLLLRCP